MAQKQQEKIASLEIKKQEKLGSKRKTKDLAELDKQFKQQKAEFGQQVGDLYNKETKKMAET